MKDMNPDPKTKLEAARRRLTALDKERSILLEVIEKLDRIIKRDSASDTDANTIAMVNGLPCPVTKASPQADKITLFQSFFRGREDVYALRFQSTRTGKSGYQPACRNEWVDGLCQKPRVKCSQCSNRQLLPMTNDVIRRHIWGQNHQQLGKDFTVGIYPLLPDDKCWFLAGDFDKKTWGDDVRAFTETCRLRGIKPAIERSRSGNGAHVWIFFHTAIEARLARRLGSTLITETMERRPEIGLDSYDRLFPNQDTMPTGGFGNLIALPFQRKSIPDGNTVFLDEKLIPFPDQWMYLGAIQRLTRTKVEAIVDDAARQGKIMGVRMVATDGQEDDPWTLPPSRRRKESPISGLVPKTVSVVLANQIYIEKTRLPPDLVRGRDMTAFGTNSTLALALPTELVKRGKLVGGRSGSKNLSEFPFRKQPKIFSAGQRCRVGDDFWGQGHQIHDLCHAGARNPRFSGNFSHAKGIVVDQHLLPLERCLNGITNGWTRCRNPRSRGHQISARMCRILDRVNNKGSGTPAGKGDTHDDFG